MNILRRISHFIIYYSYVRRRISRTDTASVCGFTLRVPKTVFHPAFYLTSRFFGTYLAKQDLKEKRGLDVGCGSGILSLAAARKGARMVALDVNPAAVSTTMENAAANRLERQIVPLKSDLFASLSPMHRNFDFILCNPPYYAGTAADMASRAWRGGEEYHFIRRLAAESAPFLRDEGSIFFILSSDVDIQQILGYFHDAGYRTTIVAQKKYVFESLMIYEASRA